MAVPYFLQATSSVAESPPELIDHHKLDEPQKRKDHITLRGQPQKMSREAHILARAAADLAAWRVACKLPPKRQSIPVLHLAFLAETKEMIYSPKL